MEGMERPQGIPDEVWATLKTLRDSPESKKQDAINQMLTVLAEPLMLAFYALGLQNGFECNITNAPTGDVFRFSFMRISCPDAELAAKRLAEGGKREKFWVSSREGTKEL